MSDPAPVPVDPVADRLDKLIALLTPKPGLPATLVADMRAVLDKAEAGGGTVVAAAKKEWLHLVSLGMSGFALAAQFLPTLLKLL